MSRSEIWNVNRQNLKQYFFWQAGVIDSKTLKKASVRAIPSGVLWLVIVWYVNRNCCTAPTGDPCNPNRCIACLTILTNLPARQFDCVWGDRERMLRRVVLAEVTKRSQKNFETRQNLKSRYDLSSTNIWESILRNTRDAAMQVFNCFLNNGRFLIARFRWKLISNNCASY